MLAFLIIVYPREQQIIGFCPDTLIGITNLYPKYLHNFNKITVYQLQ